MSKCIKILAVILILFVIYAPSCVDERANALREEAILTGTKNDIRTEFEIDYLNETSLFAYETTAKQKLSDLVDYLHIMTDTSLDMSFRAKAGEMIISTFQSENVTIQLAGQDTESIKKLKVQHLIKKGLKNKLPNQPFSFDSINIYEPIHRINNTTYSGVLKFSQNFTDPSNPEQIIKSTRRNADFWVVKEDKVFGTDSLKIWITRLGDIK